MDFKSFHQIYNYGISAKIPSITIEEMESIVGKCEDHKEFMLHMAYNLMIITYLMNSYHDSLDSKIDHAKIATIAYLTEILEQFGFVFTNWDKFIVIANMSKSERKKKSSEKIYKELFN